MADVTGGGDASDRGQLFLVGGLSLAVVLVVLAVTLNSAIYTENLATRGSDTASTNAVVQAREDVERGVGGVMEHAIDTHSGSYADQQATAESGVADLQTFSRRYAARNGRLVDLTYQSDTQGVRVARESDGDFQEGEDDADPDSWTVVSDVPAVRQFRMDVIRADLSDDGTLSNVFHVTFSPTDGDPDWTVYVRRSDSPDQTVVTVHNGGSLVGSCSYDDDGSGRAVVDVTGASVGGSYCPHLAFFDEFDSSYDIQYGNGGAARGTYELTVDKTSIANEPYDGTDAPTKHPALYDTTVRFYFESERFVYETELRVAPGEPNA